MQRSAPGEPLVAGAGRLVVDMVYTQTFKSYVQVMNALIHARWFIGTYAYVEQVVLVIDGLGIHLCVTAVIGAAA